MGACPARWMNAAASRSVRALTPLVVPLEAICLLGFVVATGAALGSVGGAVLAALRHHHHLELHLVLLGALAGTAALALELSGAALGAIRARALRANEEPPEPPVTLFVGTLTGVFTAGVSA